MTVFQIPDNLPGIGHGTVSLFILSKSRGALQEVPPRNASKLAPPRHLNSYNLDKFGPSLAVFSLPIGCRLSILQIDLKDIQEMLSFCLMGGIIVLDARQELVPLRREVLVYLMKPRDAIEESWIHL